MAGLPTFLFLLALGLVAFTSADAVSVLNDVDAVESDTLR